MRGSRCEPGLVRGLCARELAMKLLLSAFLKLEYGARDYGA